MRTIWTWVCWIWNGVRWHLVADIVAFIVGAVVFSATTFDNVTYLREGERIGPAFSTKLLLVKAESHAPICSFRAGPPDQVPVSISLGEVSRVGDFEVDVLECDSSRKFAVVHARRITPFYSVVDWLWSALRLH